MDDTILENGDESMTRPREDDEPRAKRARLGSDEAESSQGEAGALNVTTSKTPSPNASPRQAALHGAIGEDRDPVQVDDAQAVSSPATTALAWSSMNCIAVAAGARISIVPLHAPRLVCHLTVPFGEKLDSLAFGPRGDALAAVSAHKKRIHLWTRRDASLNEWVLYEHGVQLDGRIVALRWLAHGRQRSTGRGNAGKASQRPVSCGPQFGSEDKTSLLLAIVTDRGCIYIVQGSIERTASSFHARQCLLPLTSTQLLRHAAFGPVPNEPLLILGFSRDSSPKHEEGLPTEAGVPNLLLADGQDKIELVELIVQLEPSGMAPLVALRPLAPIFTGSLDDPASPFARDILQLAWAYDHSDKGPENPHMRLLAVLNALETGTHLRTWSVHRNETAKLSPAFSKLDSAKQSAVTEHDEDWTARMQADLAVEDRYLHSLSAHPARPSFFICINEAIGDPTSRGRLNIIDSNSLQVSDIGARVFDGQPAFAVSPHGFRIAAMSRGRLAIAPCRATDAEASDTFQCAVLDQDDLQDFESHQYQVSLENLSRKFIAPGALQAKVATHLAKLVCRSPASEQRGRTLRLTLEIIDVLQRFEHAQINRASDGSPGSFRIDAIWQLAAYLAFTIKLCKEAVRQAHLHVSMVGLATPPVSTVQSHERLHTVPVPETDVLDFLSSETPRKLFSLLIARLIKFVNWLAKVGSDMTSREEFVQALKASTGQASAPDESARALVEKVLLCRTRVLAVLAQTPIDLSKFGRVCKNFNASEADESLHHDEGKQGADSGESSKSDLDSEHLWWLTPSPKDSQRAAIARSILQSGSTRDMLTLFCDKDDFHMSPLGSVAGTGDGKRTSLRDYDIFTKTPLLAPDNSRESFNATSSSAKQHLCHVCLICGASKQVLGKDAKNQPCVCSASAWWATSIAGARKAREHIKQQFHSSNV